MAIKFANAQSHKRLQTGLFGKGMYLNTPLRTSSSSLPVACNQGARSTPSQKHQDIQRMLSAWLLYAKYCSIFALSNQVQCFVRDT